MSRNLLTTADHYPIVRSLSYPNAVEVVFVIFTLGFILEEFAASKEHGWTGELERVILTRLINRFSLRTQRM